ncbi:hypothetical protein ACEOHI_004603 [Vibrio parahaemolyticus]
MLDKNLFLNPIFIISASISLGSALGIQTFSDIDSGNVGKFTFELMLYITTITTGIAGSIACITNLTPISSLAEKIMTSSLKAFLGSVFGMIATAFGLLIYAFYSQSWESIKIGSIIILYIVVVFAIPPTLWVKTTKEFAKEYANNWYHKPKWKITRLTLYSGMILLGFMGVHGMFVVS